MFMHIDSESTNTKWMFKSTRDKRLLKLIVSMLGNINWKNFMLKSATEVFY